MSLALWRRATSRPTTTSISRRCLSSLPTPWFVEDDESGSHSHQHSLAPPAPFDAPLPLRELHRQLSFSPFLDTSTLLVTRPIPTGPVPLLRLTLPHGTRRKRGGTYAGESAFDVPGGLWDWLLFAQVKDGTENKGTVESVVRVVRKTLLTHRPPLLLPPNSKRKAQNGWAMVDAGNFAVHVMSKSVREKYFEHIIGVTDRLRLT